MSGCEHRRTEIWEPHLAGARKCLDCKMVYNPNHTPSWFIEPPSQDEIIKQLRAELAESRLNCKDPFNHEMLIKERARSQKLVETLELIAAVDSHCQTIEVPCNWARHTLAAHNAKEKL